MSWDPDRYRWLRSLVRRESVAEDAREELEHHLEMRKRYYVERGLEPREAEMRARERFGDVEAVRERVESIDREHLRERGRRELLGALAREILRAGRSLVRAPGFTSVALLTLALGIGATGAVFVLVEGVLLSPLSYEEPEELVWLDSRLHAQGPDARWGISEAGYHAFRSDASRLEEVGAAVPATVTLTGAGGPAERIPAVRATASMLRTLGATAAEGRLFTEEEDRPEGPDVALLGHEFWMARFGGDPGVVGSTIRLNSIPFDVVGVVEEGFHLPMREVDVWVPAGLDPDARPVNSHYLEVVGRLGPGATAGSAREELTRITRSFPDRFPGAYSPAFMEQYGFTTDVRPLRDRVVGDVGRTLWTVLAAVVLVLLIAGFNVANLHLVRGEARRRDRAVRAAMGAGRRDLLLEAGAEGALLGAGAGGAALLLTGGVLAVLRALSPPVPRLEEVALEPWTGAAVLGASVAVGVVLALLPLLPARPDLGALREEGRGRTASVRGRRFRSAMVVAQVALTVVLLTAGGLLVESFRRLRTVEPGVRTEDVVVFDLYLPWAAYEDYDETLAFHRELLGRIEDLPGVRSAGLANYLPLRDVGGCAAVFLEDRPRDATDGERPPCVASHLAAPGWFETMGIRVRGEVPRWTEIAGGNAGVVVTRALAERFWPGEDPIGKGLRPNGGEPPFYRVVGVAEDFRGKGLDRPLHEAVFYPTKPAEGTLLWQPPTSATVVVHSRGGSPTALVPRLREVVGALDPDVPVAGIRTMADVLASSDAMARASFVLFLLAVSGGMALLLSAVGVYGVVSYIQRKRTPEIGIRMALGSPAAQVRRLVLGASLRLALLGAALGLAGAWATTRYLESLLFGIGPLDPWILLTASAVVVAITLAATLPPAVRASRVDPAEALRG